MKHPIFECRKHELKYEYPGNWSELGISPPGCPLCKDEENADISAKYIEMKQHRDKLLAAIEVKLSVQSEAL